MIELDLVAIIKLLAWLGIASLGALLKGAAPTLMRAGAKRSDPSAGAALFALSASLGAGAAAWYTGTLSALTASGTDVLLITALCGLLTAVCWLSLFTALTGGLIHRVFAIYSMYYVLEVVASHFLLGTPLGLWKLCCMLLILLGMVLILSRKQGFSGQIWIVYAALALLMALCRSLLYTTRIEGRLPELAFHFGRALTALSVLIGFVLLRGRQRTLRDMPAAAWAAIPIGALMLCGGWLCDHLSAERGDPSILAPVSLLGFVAMMAFARIFHRERMRGGAVFGTMLVTLGMFAMLMGW